MEVKPIRASGILLSIRYPEVEYGSFITRIFGLYISALRVSLLQDNRDSISLAKVGFVELQLVSQSVSLTELETMML